MPLDAVTETLGIFGQKGSGKSSTSAVFVEQGVGASGRFVIADPTGVWWGLMHDGTGPGLPGIVFGGEHADVPLEPTAGHVVAEFVVQQDEYPVVVLDMKLMRKADRTKFMLAFLETLYHENREALHVVLDESHQFAPTQAREGGDQIKLLGAVEDVVALGRARGLGITMISQRFATLNANVREQIGTLVAHRLIGALDRKALKGWIEAQADPAREREVMDVMAKLKTAQALVWSPAFLDYFGVVDVNAPKTFDSRATPKVGQRVKKPGKRAPVDLATLRDRMAATIEQAEANDPKLLRKRVFEAETKLRAALLDIESRPTHEQVEEMRRELRRLQAVAEQPREVEVPVIAEDDLAELDRIVTRLWSVRSDLIGLEHELGTAAGPLTDALRVVRDAKSRPAVPPRLQDDARAKARVQGDNSDRRDGAGAADTRPTSSHSTATSPSDAHRTARSRPEAVPERAASGGASISRRDQKILDGIAWWKSIGVPVPTVGQLGFVVGYHSRSKGFTNALSALSTAGLVQRSPGAVALTGEGDALANYPAIAPTEEELHRLIYEQIGAARAKILEALIARRGEFVRVEDLAVEMDYHPRSKGFTNSLSRLSSLGLADRQPGEVRASELCFL